VPVSDLAAFGDHAWKMTTALHRPECLTRLHPWLKATPRPGCTGCVTDDERALWIRLAEETDSYLTTHPEETLL
jgi:hypothetical protein